MPYSSYRHHTYLGPKGPDRLITDKLPEQGAESKIETLSKLQHNSCRETTLQPTPQMIEPTNTWAEGAAELALNRAQEACIAAQIDPILHEELLASFVIEEVRIAVAEMAHCKAHGGPTAAFMLTQPFYQRIFFADAGRRAAHTLIKEMQRQPSCGVPRTAFEKREANCQTPSENQADN